MKLKFLPIVLLALSFAACDTYEETDDVANQRAEQEAFVKAENLKDAYSEYTSAYIDWSSKSNSFTEIEKTINKYKQSLILLETGYDEAAVKAMKESDKAQYEDELTVAQARLHVLETEGVDVKVLRTEIEAKNEEILALGDHNGSDTFQATRDKLDNWYNTYSDGSTLSLIWGKGYDLAIWTAKAPIIKNNLSIAIEPIKDILDIANKRLADSKEVYNDSLVAYTNAKTARDEAKVENDAAQAAFDAADKIVKDAEIEVANAEVEVADAEIAYAAVESDENKEALDSAKENVLVAKVALTKAEADLSDPTTILNNAIAAFNNAEIKYYKTETNYKAVTAKYEIEQRKQREAFGNYYWAKKAYTDFNIEALKTELTELNAAYAASYIERNKINVLKAQKAELENTMFFIEAHYDNVSGTEEYIKTKISSIEDTIDDLKNDIKKLNKDLADIAQGIFNLSDDGYTTGLNATQIQEAIASNEAKLVASNELLAAAKTQLDNAKAAYEALLAQHTEKADAEASSDE